MAPISHRTLDPRNSETDMNLIIAFSAIGIAIVMVCIVWGFFIPQWRRKRSESRAHTKDSWSSSTSGRRFPSHPAILRGFKKQQSRKICCYDPYTETPFPGSPPLGDNIDLPSIKLRSSSSSIPRNIYNSHGLFTPAKDPPSRPLRARPSKAVMMPEIPLKRSRYPENKQEFGDATDYILAIPEPLALKARSAGRAPPLTKQLEKFPTPGSSNSEKLAHPNKLFVKLQDVHRQKRRAGNSAELLTQDCKAESDEDAEESSIFGPRRYGNSGDQLNFVDKKSIESTQADVPSTINAGMYTSTRSKAYWNPFSDTYGRSGHDLARSGTVTRPKTPVADLRNKFDRGVPELQFKLSNHPYLKKHLTPPSEQLTTSASTNSEILHSSTPPSSLQRVPSAKLPLLPTPLRPRKAYMRPPADTPTPDPLQDRGRTPSSAALPEFPDELAPLHKSLQSNRPKRRSIGFYHARSSRHGTSLGRDRDSPARSSPQQLKRPANLNLTNSFRIQPPCNFKKNRSVSSLGSIIAPLVSKNPARCSAQASSIYSRDTKGTSIVRTPLTASLPTETTIKQSASIENMGPRRATSFDIIRTKIDEWDLHIDDLEIPNSPSVASILKRTLSDQGPRSPALVVRKDDFYLPALDFRDGRRYGEPVGLGISIPTICIGRTSDSDDVFHDTTDDRGSGGGAVKRSFDKDMSGSEQSNLSSIMGKVAPGDAMWI